jgi:hypothetical protein
MTRFIALGYRGPVIGAPEHILCIVEANAWEPSRHFFNVSLLQDLKRAEHGVTKWGVAGEDIPCPVEPTI